MCDLSREGWSDSSVFEQRERDYLFPRYDTYATVIVFLSDSERHKNYYFNVNPIDNLGLISLKLRGTILANEIWKPCESNYFFYVVKLIVS